MMILSAKRYRYVGFDQTKHMHEFTCVKPGSDEAEGQLFTPEAQLHDKANECVVYYNRSGSSRKVQPVRWGE